ncbi:glutamate receptor 2.7-like [Papaver somniferum]|uniref:glutamate receptor 2.7-like n=1 Tax=Papaver somniferum TaxID=3469 RepID=UPI000E6FD392|nr:glutamate receptor 2.7-like [Papaver somniferum]
MALLKAGCSRKLLMDSPFVRSQKMFLNLLFFSALVRSQKIFLYAWESFFVKKQFLFNYFIFFLNLCQALRVPSLYATLRDLVEALWRISLVSKYGSAGFDKETKAPKSLYEKWAVGDCAATLQGGEAWNLGLDRRLLQTQVDEVCSLLTGIVMGDNSIKWNMDKSGIFPVSSAATSINGWTIYYHLALEYYQQFKTGGHGITVMAEDAKQVDEFKVGVDSDVPEVKACLTSINMALADLNASTGKRRLSFHFRNSKEDIVEAASAGHFAAIYLIRKKGVQAIIGPTTSAQTVYMMHLGNRSHVPVISFSATSPSISPVENPYFIRTTLNDSSQVGAIAAIVKYFGWTEAAPLYADTEYGKGIIPYLVDELQNINTRVPYRSVFPSAATDEQIDDELNRLIRMQTRVFIVHMTAPLGVRIFAKAKELDMMAEEYCWVITDGLGDYLSSFSNSVLDTMEGVIGIRPYVPESEKLKSFRVRWKKRFQQEHPNMMDRKLDMFGIWAYDTVVALASAVEKLGSLNPKFNKRNLTALDSSDVERMCVSQIGPELLGKISNITRKDAMSGTFNIVKGQLQNNTFEILNVVGNGYRQIGTWTPSDGIINNTPGTNKSKTADTGNLGTIIWPGDPK